MNYRQSATHSSPKLRTNNTVTDKRLFQSENMADVQNDTQLAIVIGEMRGQVREMIHAQNNIAMKVDAISQMVMLAAGLPDTVSALSTRVATLEADLNKREGATGVVSAILKSPTLGWIVGAITTIYLYLSGKLDL